MLFYFTPSVIRFDVVIIADGCCFCYFDVTVYISTNFEFCFGIGIREHFLFVYKHCVKFSEKFLMCDCYLFIFMLFLLKLRMVTQLEMKKLLFVER